MNIGLLCLAPKPLFSVLLGKCLVLDLNPHLWLPGIKIPQLSGIIFLPQRPQGPQSLKSFFSVLSVISVAKSFWSRLVRDGYCRFLLLYFTWNVKEHFNRYTINKKLSVLLTGSPGAGFNCLT